MAISDKLNYLIETKQLFKDRLNSLGAEITSSTTFRNYLTWLDTFYGEVSNKTDISQNGVVGRTSQESTTWKNKYGITSVETKVYGSGLPNANTNNIIVDEYDLNNIKFHTKATGQYFQVLFPTYQLEPNTSYIITYNRTNNLSSGANSRRFIYSLDNENNYAIIHYLTANDDGDMHYTFTTTETGKIAIAFGFYNNASVNSSEINNLMVRLASDTDATFEPYTYGASPNPDYPQPINNLSGDVPYKVSGKNLLDTNRMVQFTPSSSSWYSVDGIDRFYNTTQIIKSNVYYDLKANTTYTFSIYSTLNKNTSVGNPIQLVDKSGQVITSISQNNTYMTFTTTEDIRAYPRMSVQSANVLTQCIVQLEKGSIVTEYEPYISQTFNIPLGDIELCNIDTYEDKIYSSDGRFYLEKNIGKETDDGSSDETWYKFNREINGCYGFRHNGLYSEILLCDKLTNYTAGQLYQGIGEGIGFSPAGGYLAVYIKSERINSYDTSIFRTFLANNPITYYYQLATPTTTEITQENYPSLYNALKQIQDYLTAYKINKEFILGYSSPEIEY